MKTACNFFLTFLVLDVQFEMCKSDRVSRKVMNVDLIPLTDVETEGELQYQV